VLNNLPRRQQGQIVFALTEKNMKPLRILIADDHDLFRWGVKALLQSHAGWEICGEARTGSEAVDKAKELMPDVVILDIRMPDLNGVEAARRIRMASKEIEILILSISYSDQLIREIIEAGVRGYVLKSDADNDLLLAVETLAAHKPFFIRRAGQAIQSEFDTDEPVRKIPELLRDRLTSREREVLRLLGQSIRCKEIGSVLGISPKTAETHRANMMRKLDLHSMSEVARYALRNQIIEP
jgi:DNA-binding NarL/FixJ family response regulator